MLGYLRRRVEAYLPPTAPLVWYHEAYRLPLPAMERQRGIEVRRADYVAWTLLEHHRFPPRLFRRPGRVSFRDLARVHGSELLEGLTRPDMLARVFAVSPEEVDVDLLVDAIRLACGGTLAAAREALRTRTVTLNLIGGFHHASPSRAAALCPANDIAVSVAALREQGLRGSIVILDLDAHPPDGTGECLATDSDTWIGSLSAADWGPLEGPVDETVLPVGTGDDMYLAALAGLLRRMPKAPVLAYVIAGGDVLAGDNMGKLGLSLVGARERDRRVHGALAGVPAVWLPGGGYHGDSWRVLVGTALTLAGRRAAAAPPRFDPMRVHFGSIGRQLGMQLTGGDLSLGDLGAELNMPFAAEGSRRLLGFYTASGAELALESYGVLDHLRRSGFRDLRVAIDRASQGDRLQLFGTSGGREHLLGATVLEIVTLAGHQVLWCNWLMLQDPRAPFTAARPRLPGQEAPGLGIGREAQNLLRGIADRLDLAAVAFRTAHYHIARFARHEFEFVDPVRQGRFEALMRDTAELPLADVTAALDAGRVFLDGAPYRWEADDMISTLERSPEDLAAIVAERERARFTVQ